MRSRRSGMFRTWTRRSDNEVGLLRSRTPARNWATKPRPSGGDHYVRNADDWQPVFGLLNGGLDLAIGSVRDAEPAWFCEWDDAPSKILAHRWPHVPNYRDVTQVDWHQVPPIDILAGGSPCQDLSQAGKRAGMTEGTRSNLWVNMREAIAVLKPRLVVWENVLGALSAEATSDSDMEPGTGLLGDGGGGHLRALGRVLGDLAEIGYDAAWTTVRASDVGAPHHRARVFLIATPTDAAGERVQVGGRLTRDSEQGYPSFALGGDVLPANSSGFGLEAGRSPRRPEAEVAGHNDRERSFPDTQGVRCERPGETREGWAGLTDCHNRTVEWGDYAPAVRRWERVTRPAPAPTETNAKGKPRLNAAFAEWMMGLPTGHVTSVPGLTRAEQLKAIGNGVCPQQGAMALRELLTMMEETFDHRF